MFFHIVRTQFKQQDVTECKKKKNLKEKSLMTCKYFKFKFSTFIMKIVGATKALPCAQVREFSETWQQGPI